METNKLFSIASQSGITIDFVEMPNVRSAAIRCNNRDFVAIDQDMRSGSAEEKVTLAHEIGHCETGAFYDPSAARSVRLKPEQRAGRWAIRTLIPKEELAYAIKNGYESISSLAEYFGVTEDFMQKAIQHYCENKTA